MKNLVKIGAGAALAVCLVTCLGVATAFAGSVNQDTKGKNTMWEIPTGATTNTVDVEGTSYKVITTWANAWATGGPDYIGISNSCYLATEGGGTTYADKLEDAQQNSLLGIWASTANEVPNAYNWNCFWNLYVSTDEGIAAGAQAADFETTDVQWDTESGVYGAFKYRPEIIWTSNGLRSNAVAQYVDYINDGDYYSADGLRPDEDGYTPPTDSSPYYCDGDENYDPYIFDANNQSAYGFVDSFYALADYADQIIDQFKDNTGTATDWKGMNSLPRTTRYEAVGLSAQDCAVNVDRVTRASVYYVLSQIAAGTVEKKKVAYLASSPTTGTSTVTVNAYDYIENVGQGPNNGYASYSPLVVDQLITDEDVSHKSASTQGSYGGGSSGLNDSSKTSDLYYTQSTATADDLLDCDIVYVTNGRLDASDIEAWLIEESTLTDAEATQKAEKLQICASAPAIMQWSNYCAEKLIYGTYAVNFFYPELFPNMELVGYWYDQVYHLNTESVAVAMGYTFGNADLPAGVTLTDLANSYSKDSMESKFNEGLEYFMKNFDTDPTLSRLAAGQALDPTDTTVYAVNAYKPDAEFVATQMDAMLADTSYMTAFAAYIKTLPDDELGPYADMLLEVVNGLAQDNSAQQDLIATLEKELKEAQAAANKNSGSKGGSSLSKQTIKAKKSVKAKKGKAKIKVTGAKTALKVTAKGKAKKALKIKVKKGKITVKAKKKGTYKIQVYAAASSKYAKSNTLKIKVKVK